MTKLCMIENIQLVLSGKSCPVLLPPTHGSVVSGYPETGLYEYQVTLGCDAGYALSGSSIRTCNASGLWDGEDTVCSGKLSEVHSRLFVGKM